MRKRDRDIIGRLRRAVARVIGPGGLLGLALAGAGGADPAAMRVVLRLRGGCELDGAVLVALARRLRRVMRLEPGMRLPMLVIRQVANEAEAPACAEARGPRNDAAVPDRDGLEGRHDRRVALAAGEKVIATATTGGSRGMAKAAQRAGLCGVYQKDERRRSRSPPSPWSVWLSACG